MDTPRFDTLDLVNTGDQASQRVLAPAKLTTSLSVVGVRSDGMHEIDAEMITINLFDELVVSPGGSGVTIEGVAANSIDPSDNLVTRAGALANVEVGVHLHKRIPAGAGLGGGSADAAALLRWAGFDDVERSASIGADVAFCLVGGRARVRGIGEIVEPLPFIEQTFTIISPPVHCSTPAVYAKWDAMGSPKGANGNDLEPAALAVAPELAITRDLLGNATGQTPRLAGSGSSWFVEGRFPEVGLVVDAIAAQ